MTDPLWAQAVTEAGGRAIVVPDIPAERPEVGPARPTEGVTIAVVNTWAPDEPLDDVVEAAKARPKVTFLVTGRTTLVSERFPRPPSNVRFTGFLDEPTYLGLLRDADAVMCLTTRDHTMQRGACEAMALGTPVITSDWGILRSHFADGAVYVGNTSSGIADGIDRFIADNQGYRQRIVEVRDQRRREWLENKRALTELLQATSPSRHIQ